MKKNWLTYIVISSFLSGGLMSCNEADFLNLKDPNHFTNDDFWADKSDAESALAAAYSPIKYQMNGYYGAFDGWLNLNSRGDDIFTILNEEASMWDIATFQNSATTGNDPYGALYTGIQRANIVLKYIDTVPAGGISDKDRAIIKGEALVLRAYQYYLLVTNYGKVPLRLIPSNEDVANKPAASEAEIWNRIETDFNTAINECNLPETRSAEEKGRIEKGCAMAMLGKAYLTQKKYPEAYDILGTLIRDYYGSGKRYQLMENFADNFTPEKENNAESVFELQYSTDGDLSWGNESGINLGSSLAQFVGPAITGGWAKLMPSAFLVSEFVKEPRAMDSNGADSKFDKRMYSSLFFDPSVYGDWVQDNDWYSSEIYGGRYDIDALWEGNAAKMTGGAPSFSVSGVASSQCKFLLKKYAAYFVDASNADSMGNRDGRSNNVRVMRFAEVLLMYAEACVKTGDVNQANWALTEIRNRAGLPQKTFALGELMTEIEHQCLLEFFGEGHRFDDLKRWYNTSKMKLIFRSNDKQGGENFEEKYRYYPIPSGELNNNSAMQQSDLWK